MNRHLIIYILLGVSLAANAQSDGTLTRSNAPVKFVPGSALLQTNPTTGMAFQAEGSPFITEPASNTYSIKQPTDHNRADSTRTKKGELHGSVGLSVMAGFGKGAPKGAGFAQNINLDYTVLLSKHVWLTMGGYMSHLNWDGINTTNAGLYGELGYQFDEHWSAYIYGQKSIVNSGMDNYYGYPYAYGYWGGGIYGYPGYNPWGDKLGAALRWTPNKNFSLQISVEKNWYPKPQWGYNRKYDYQRGFMPTSVSDCSAPH